MNVERSSGSAMDGCGSNGRMEATMVQRIVRVGVIVGLVMAAAPLRAQRMDGGSGGSIELAPYAGYMITSDYLSGPLNTSLTTSGGALYGIQMGLPLGRSVSLYGNVAYSNPSLRIGLPILGGVDFGRNEMLLYDGGLELRAPARIGAASPFLQLGAGAVHNSVSAGPIDLRATNFAANAGLGVDVGVLPNATLRLMAKDYVGKFDFREATGFGGVDGKTAHNIGLSAGLRVAF